MSTAIESTHNGVSDSERPVLTENANARELGGEPSQNESSPTSAQEPPVVNALENKDPDGTETSIDVHPDK